MDNFFWYITKMQYIATENPLKLTTAIPYPVCGEEHWKMSVARLNKKFLTQEMCREIKGYQTFVSFIFFVFKCYLISSQNASINKK